MFARRLILAGLVFMLLLIGCVLTAAGDGLILDQLILEAKHCVTLIYLALGAAVLIAAGKVDLSSASALHLFGILAIWISNISQNPTSIYLPVVVALVLSLGMYGAFGFLLSSIPKLSALILTLAASFVIVGINNFILIGLQGSGPLADMLHPNNETGLFNSLTPDKIGNVLPYWMLHAAGLMVVVTLLHIWRYSTRAGLWHVALGENELASRRVGVNRSSVLLPAFVIAGILVFLAWLNEFYVVRTGAWNIDSVKGYELLAITSAVIGGTRIEGGRLDPLSVMVAAAFVQLAYRVTNYASLPSETSYLVTGLLLAISCYLDGKNRSQVDESD